MEMAWESDTLPAIVFDSSAKVDRVVFDQNAPNQGPYPLGTRLYTTVKAGAWDILLKIDEVSVK